ncbi:MAG: Hsp20/alpha crystallin family protein [Deltaproteobacteria bacterium]|nr:Hsp20/alpha crystallin family protein [Deltaproteobacteria bacterium]
MSNAQPSKSQEVARQAQNEALDQRRTITPRVDIFENDEALTLLADLPGVTKDALVVRIEKDELRLEGAVEPDAHAMYGAFVYRRVFALPSGIDAEKVNAELKNGVLRLQLPKSAAKRTRVVPIKAA